MITRDTTELKNVFFSYGEKEIFRDFSHVFPSGKTTAVIGPSGAGKTTLLNLLAGLIRPAKGEITVPAPIAVLFQEPRLCPWLTALKNVELVLNGKKNAPAKGAEWLSRVGLGKELNAYPDELSGGMQQRVALARTLAYAEDCPIALLDEPFKGLDKALHEEMTSLTRDTLKGKTVILITHSETEAALSDEILEIRPAEKNL